MENTLRRIYRWPAAAALLVASLLVASCPASAHTGIGSSSGFGVGFLHPLGGMDHLLAMVAVGMLGANLGNRAVWLVPTSFIVMMGIGAALGQAGLSIQAVELGIAMSLVVLGGLLVLRAELSTALAMAVVGSFGLFHGHAHGAEMPATVAGLTYGIGFVAATALLHAGGIGLTRLRTDGLAELTRLYGGFVVLTGLALASGAV